MVKSTTDPYETLNDEDEPWLMVIFEKSMPLFYARWFVINALL